MVFVHELGHFLFAKAAGVRVDEFAIGFPPRLFGFKRGETTYTLNAILAGGYVRMLGEDDPSEPRSFAQASRVWRILILAGGSAMNLAAAVAIFAAAHLMGWPTVTQFQVQIVRIAANSPAEQAGVRPGDIVLRLGGQPIERVADLSSVTRLSLGAPLRLEVRRDSAIVPLDVTPRREWPTGEGPIGVEVRESPARVEPVAYGLAESARRGAAHTLRMTELMVTLPVLAVRGLFPAELLRPVGPVGLFQATSQAAAETVRSGWAYPLLALAGTLGVGLAIANLLPIPGLDGGRLLFIALEIVRRRRVSPEREGLIHMIGMSVLLALVIVITYFDVFSPVDLDFSLP